MYWIYQAFFIFLIFSPIKENFALNNNEFREDDSIQPQRIQSRMLEVLMHLPPEFHDIDSFKNFFRAKPSKLVLSNELQDENLKGLVEVNAYEIAQPERSTLKREKREASSPTIEKAEAQKLVSALTETEHNEDSKSDMILPMPEAIRGPMYTTYPIKEFDTMELDDSDYSKRRKNESAESREDNSQRDKRTFGEEGADYDESTTTTAFWKRKKENPPFITGRGSSAKNTNNNYTPPQHRTLDNSRESHSMKTLEKTSEANEVSRPLSDNYYSSTNRRAYSRQSDMSSSSTPKSVYDTIDYSKKNQGSSRLNLVRNYEDRKEIFRDVRPTHEQFVNRQYVYNYPVHEQRPYYQLPQYPSEIVGRGVEYYHKTYEPSTGRIIYYPSMPENGRSLDSRYVDTINRNFYVNKPVTYDVYYRNFVPPQEFNYPSGVNNQMDFMRMGRSNSQAYSYSYRERDKYQRDPRFTMGHNKNNRIQNDDVRNKTYIIYDADDDRPLYGKTQFFSDYNRPVYPPPINNNYRESPIISYREAPINGYRESPINNYREAPINGYREIPINSYREIPVNSYREIPVNSYREIPVNSYREIPVNSYREIPINGYRETPINNYREIPINSYRELPVSSYRETQESYRSIPGPPLAYQSSRVPYRSQNYISSSTPFWSYNQGSPSDGRWPVNPNVNYNRPVNPPEVQQNVMVSDRNLPSRELDNNKKI